MNASLRDINMQLKQPSTYQRQDRSRNVPYRPKIDFFLAENQTPKFMFTTQLSFLPTQGEMFSIENSKFKVVEVTRNLDLSVDKRFAKEAEIKVLLSRYYGTV